MSSLYWPYLIADYYHILELLAVLVGVVILLSSLDDIVIDVCYWARLVYRKLTVNRRYAALTAEQLRARQEQPLAIMVPAWLEFDVIAPMLENMVSMLEYKNYMIFVGTYCNDPQTIDEVERMRQRYRHLVRVEVPHAGPTCKADCLNWIVQAIFAEEKKQAKPFAGMILHDSEDVLHPLELKYYNYLLPRIDFIQLPVISLEREWYELVASTYMDEFAEWHNKDLVVRESLSGMVPSAGTGTCFSRQAMATLAAQTENQPFNSKTLTEDYDIGVRLSKHDMKQILGKFHVEYLVRRKSLFGFGKEQMSTLRMPLGVREYFPNTFVNAYRQKARWVMGIALQGWQHMGWHGSLADKYLLMRDRKALVTSFVAILAYVLLLHFLVFFILDKLGIWTIYYPSNFAQSSWLPALMVLNAFALLLRVIQRVYFVSILYGWEHALLAIPRMVISNFINAAAAARAWRLFTLHLITGKPLAWDKTLHDFPTRDQFVQQKLRLGELLLSWQAIDEDILHKALEIQQKEKQPLGEIMIKKNWLNQSTLDEAIAFQQGIVAQVPSSNDDAMLERRKVA